MSKEIWLPKSETRATVRDGVVYPWDEMKFTVRPVGNPSGFQSPIPRPSEDEKDEASER